MKCVHIGSFIERAGAPATRHKVRAWPGLRSVIPKLRNEQQVCTELPISQCTASDVVHLCVAWEVAMWPGVLLYCVLLCPCVVGLTPA
jgi:hypothetical protein